MNKNASFKRWCPALAGLLSCVTSAAQATVWMDGEVSLDYYIAGVSPEGYEEPELEFYVERVVNNGAAPAGSLSLGGWLTRNSSPGGAGAEVGYLPLDSLPANSATTVFDTVAADDTAPGEYYMHTLLQDDRDPGTYEDSRTLSPRLLWRGGLEAQGPLQVYADSRGLSVDFNELRNNRLDSRFTNDIVLTLYATYGFGPASDGHLLCETIVPGLYAGDARYAPGFDCSPNAIPDGEYSLHLMVAELGGRGGSSTLSGPDAYFRNGRLDRVYGSDGCCVYSVVYVYHAGSLGLLGLLPLAVFGLRRVHLTFLRSKIKE